MCKKNNTITHDKNKSFYIILDFKLFRSSYFPVMIKHSVSLKKKNKPDNNFILFIIVTLNSCNCKCFITIKFQHRIKI